MSAERFNVTGRGPSAACVAVVCAEQALSLSTVFISLYVNETGHFVIENCPCVARWKNGKYAAIPAHFRQSNRDLKTLAFIPWS